MVLVKTAWRALVCALAMVACAPAAFAQRSAEIVFVVDESGSMSGEQQFLQAFVPSLEQQLQAAGLQIAKFGLVGYGNSAVVPRQFLIGGQPFGSATDFATAAGALEVSGGTEDGYAGIQYVLDNYAFSGGASTAVIVLVTDEDRDNTDNALTFQVILTNLQSANASLSAIINQEINGPGGEVGIATDGTITYVDANNDGVPEELGAPTFGFASGTTFEDYTQLVLSFSDGCVADLNQLRAGGTIAQAFAETLARCLIQQALGGSGRGQFLIAPTVASRIAALHVADSLMFRLSGRFGGFDGAGGEGAPVTVSNAAGTRRGFAIASYMDGNVDAIADQPNFDFDGYQLIVGMDADVNDTTLAGFALAYSDGESSADGTNESWDHEVITIAGYASKKLPHAVHLDGVISAGMADYTTSRPVVALTPGAPNRASAEPEGHVYAARVRASRTFALIPDELDVTPHVGATYTHVKIDSYTETGPGAVTVGGFASDVSTADLGVDIQGNWTTQWGLVRPSLQLGGEWAFANDDDIARITTASGGGFDQLVPALSDWTNVVGVGAALIRDGFTGRLGYEARIGEQVEAHSVSIRGRWVF
ncbi:MAG: autotransporter domain-containing protein [Alphaproteobacteria bacterium]|nr:autotransporter domain-containing protein [Alphaproteobacteria bacterium]